MTSRPNRPKHLQLWLLTAAVAAAAAALLGIHFAGEISYAIEKGQLTAAREELSQQDVASVQQISRVFRLVAKTVKPSVVHIATVSGSQPEPRSDSGEGELPEMWRRFFGDDLPPEFFRQNPRLRRRAPTRGLGTGVVVDDQGHVLTNNHVVDGAEKITVRLADERKFTAKLIGADEATDLAVIKIDADRLHPATFGKSSEVEVGDWVMAVGNPFGLSQSVSAGIISAKGRSQIGLVDYENFLQTDAAINPGNSGGPLVNVKGEVIGLNTAIPTRTGVYSGFGFAIPSDMAVEIMKRLVTGKPIVRGYLGVGIQDLDEGLAKSFDFEGTDGVLIGGVKSGGPADRGGLKRGDIVTGIDGRKITRTTELQNVVAMTEPGTTVTFDLWRNRKPTRVKVTIGKQPAGFSTRGSLEDIFGPDEADEPEVVTSEKLGFTAKTLTPALAKQYRWPEQTAGVVITEVAPGGVAGESALAPGDLIAEVEGKRLQTASQLEAVLKKTDLSKGLRLFVRSQRGSRYLFLQAR